MADENEMTAPITPVGAGEGQPVQSLSETSISAANGKSKSELSFFPPVWLDGKQINEVMFCHLFLKKHPMKCIHNAPSAH